MSTPPASLGRNRLLLDDARQTAERFIAELAGTYDRIEIAGSVRRCAESVKDVEILAVPTIVRTPVRDLFGETIGTTTVDQLDARMHQLVEHDLVQRRTRPDGRQFWGPMAKFVLYDGVGIDLFTPDAGRWGWILALRTGPAEFSTQLVVPIGTRTRHGRPGLLPPAYRPRDGWLTYRASAERIETPEETDIFERFGLPYTEPWNRV